MSLPRLTMQPYGLFNHLKVTHANQVWAIDITYIPMKKGYHFGMY